METRKTARARVCVCGSWGWVRPQSRFPWCDTRLFFALNFVDGALVTASNKKPPKAFNSQGALVEASYLLASSKRSRVGSGRRDSGMREHSAPGPKGRKERAAEEAARLRPGPSSGPAEPCRESWDVAAGGFLTVAFWSLALDKYSLAFAP